MARRAVLIRACCEAGFSRVITMSDELTRPLGVAPPPRSRSFRRAGFVLAALGVIGAAGLVGFIALFRASGEPVAVAPIVVRESAAPPAPVPPAESARRSAQAVEGASGVSVFRPPGEAAPSSVVIRVPEVPVRLEAAPDPRLVEHSRYGLLPKVGADGARPVQVYARPAPAKTGPRVAIVVGGLGIGLSATGEAISKLPPAVTLAFAPYGSDLERFVSQARDDGHEVMLQVPMEPFDYPDNDPGPHTLTVRARPQENIERLQWIMGRFTGYTGLVTFMGAKLTADEAALTSILKALSYSTTDPRPGPSSAPARPRKRRPCGRKPSSTRCRGRTLSTGSSPASRKAHGNAASRLAPRARFR
jgi:uncharacterized protein